MACSPACHAGTAGVAHVRAARAPGAALVAGGSGSGCLVRGPPGGLGGPLVAGVPADHRENGLGVRVVQSRYSLEGLIRLRDPADPPEFREVEGEPLLTKIKVTE